jgi:hypothetical protein
MLLKRKHDELDDSEDESSYGKQILPVANLPDDFNEEPSDGMQYLFTVRYVLHNLVHKDLSNDSGELHVSFQMFYVPNPFETEERMISET